MSARTAAADVAGAHSLEQIVVGRINGPYGVRGWVKLTSYTVPPANIAEYQPWTVNGIEVKVVGLRAHGELFVAQIDGCVDRDDAARLSGREIAVAASVLPVLPSGDFYWRQLIGVQVRDVAGSALGLVEGILSTGANDVLVVRTAAGKELLIPFLDQVVGEVNVDEGWLVADWGLDY